MTTEYLKDTLDGIEREAEANRVFDQGPREALAKGPDALAQFMSDSAADGKGGAVKFKAVTLPDGEGWQMHRVSDEGHLSRFGRNFTSDETGMATAGLLLSRAVPATGKVAHLKAALEAARERSEGKA